MASPTETDTIRSAFLQQMWDHDPGGTGATFVSPDGGTTVRSVDMRDYTDFSVACMTTVLGGNGPTLLEIVAADNAALSTNAIVIKTSGTIAADAVGDWAIETCTAAEIAQEGADNGSSPRYVGGRITCHHTGDEAAVAYFAVPKRPTKDLTAQTTIA